MPIKKSIRLEQMRALDWESKSLTELSAEIGISVRAVSALRARLLREKYPELDKKKKMLDVEKAKTQLHQALLSYGKATGDAQALEMSLRLAMLPTADLAKYWRPADMRHWEQP